MNKSKYIEKLLLRFNMHNCKPRATPCEMGITKLCEDNSEPADSTDFRELVGSLVYVMTCTRPDICFVVTKLSQYLSKPMVSHVTMAKHVLRYLKGTIDQSLIFKKSSNSLNLTGFCDADWAKSNDRRSITGCCFTLSPNGPSISWKSRKQQVVALSTCEAEYMALTAATQESKFLIKLVNSMLSCDLSDSVKLYCDNQGAMALAKNPVQHQRSKHIDIKFHFVHFEVQKGVIQLVHVPSEQNLADIFTKPQTGVKLKRFLCSFIGFEF